MEPGQVLQSSEIKELAQKTEVKIFDHKTGKIKVMELPAFLRMVQGLEF